MLQTRITLVHTRKLSSTHAVDIGVVVYVPQLAANMCASQGRTQSIQTRSFQVINTNASYVVCLGIRIYYGPDWYGPKGWGGFATSSLPSTKRNTLTLRVSTIASIGPLSSGSIALFFCRTQESDYRLFTYYFQYPFFS